MLPKGCWITKEKEEAFDGFASFMTLSILTCLVQAEDWWIAKAMLHVVFAGCTEPERTGDAVQFLSVSTAQCHRPPPPHTSSIREGGGEFSLPFDVWSAPVLVTLSPWGSWGTRQLNAAKSLWWTQAAIDLSCKTVLPFLDCVASCSRSPAGLADRPAEGRALEGVVTWSTLCGQGNLRSVCTG